MRKHVRVDMAVLESIGASKSGKVCRLVIDADADEQDGALVLQVTENGGGPSSSAFPRETGTLSRNTGTVSLPVHDPPAAAETHESGLRIVRP